MTSVEKSPNMISTTGLIPVIAAPTAIPVKPASDMGVSTMRSVPNSSTSPLRTLYTVPASAMSSPQMKTRESRRISSARASRTASPKVNSRVSGIYVLVHLVCVWIRSSHRKFDGLVHFRLHFRLDLIQSSAIGEILGGQPIGKQLDGIPLGFPHLLFFLRAVILAIDVAHMVAHEAVRVANEECRSLAGADSIDDRVRAGQGPAFLVCNTYRFMGHHVGDVNREYYRPKKEEQMWKTERDPVKLFADWLTAQNLADRARLDQIQAEVQSEVDKAVEFAVAAPYPNADKVDQDVYA